MNHVSEELYEAEKLDHVLNLSCAGCAGLYPLTQCKKLLDYQIEERNDQILKLLVAKKYLLQRIDIDKNNCKRQQEVIAMQERVVAIEKQIKSLEEQKQRLSHKSSELLSSSMYQHEVEQKRRDDLYRHQIYAQQKREEKIIETIEKILNQESSQNKTSEQKKKTQDS
jgi:hypothetical protein